MENLSHSAQDYLEAILILSQEGGKTRVKDVADHLQVKKPSVVVAIKGLAEKGLVNHEHYGYVELTEEGHRVARQIYHRHQVLMEFLSRVLGLDPELAEKDACQMEHYISPLTLERLVKFVEFVDNFPTLGQEPKWLTHFKRYVETGEPPPCREDHLKG